MSEVPKLISHYEVEEELGRGGMGIVYRARDTALDRTVALKLLTADSLATDAEKERFQREARSAAALNHPHIATIYEIGETSDEHGKTRSFIAMEFVDGKPLSQIIAEGPLSIERAALIGGQIAGALSAAHAKGIVHRDVKPDNVLVTNDGTAKVLDFGIAKSAAVTTITVEGATLGTIAYMSPEQARGELVDSRSDIWSLGAVLYEMISGRKPFQGAYDQAIVYSILNEDPEPLTAIRTGVPMELEMIAGKALEKDPHDRYQHADELQVDLDRLARGKTRSTGVHTVVGVRKKPPLAAVLRFAPWFVAVAAVLVTILVLNREEPGPLRAAQRLTFTTDTLVLGEHPATPIVSITPDGSRIIYRAERAGVPQLFVREVDSYDAVTIPGTENAHGTFFSPDGTWFGYAADGVLYKKPTQGGAAIAICEAEVFHGATWGTNGIIVFSMISERHGLVIYSVSAGGGVPRQLTEIDMDAGEFHHLYPEFIPGEKEVLFASVNSAGRGAKIWVLSIESGVRHFLIDGGNPKYLSTGRLLYPLNGSLWGVRLGTDPVELRGEPAVVADGLLMGFTYEPSIGHYAVSESGTLVYLPGSENAASQSVIVSVDREGNERVVMNPPRPAGGARWAPDEDRIALRMPDVFENMQVWVYDLRRETLTQLTTENQNWWPVWIDGGRRVAFPHATAISDTDVHWAPADRSSEPTFLVGTPGVFEVPYSASADGRTLFYQRQEPGSVSWDIWALDINSPDRPREVLATETNDFNPVMSPDGKWLAFVSSSHANDRRGDVFVTDYPGLSRRWQISNGGALGPSWSGDGRRIFYHETTEPDGSGRISAVDWTTEPEVRPGRPEPVFSGETSASVQYGRMYDVSSTGELLVVQTKELEPQTKLNIVIDWFTELESLVP